MRHHHSCYLNKWVALKHVGVYVQRINAIYFATIWLYSFPLHIHFPNHVVAKRQNLSFRHKEKCVHKKYKSNINWLFVAYYMLAYNRIKTSLCLVLFIILKSMTLIKTLILRTMPRFVLPCIFIFIFNLSWACAISTCDRRFLFQIQLNTVSVRHFHQERERKRSLP